MPFLVLDDLYLGDFGNYYHQLGLIYPEIQRLIEQVHDKRFIQLKLDNSPVRKLIDADTSPEKLATGLPLYVSIFESAECVQTVIETAMGILGIIDTQASDFLHLQCFPAEKQRDVILPLLFAPQEIDGKRYADGGIGGWQKSQGNTPITPLITQAGCSHIIVTHLTDSSLWNCYNFPDTTILEIRPKKPIA